MFGGYDPKNPSKPINLRELYLESLEDKKAVKRASIPVENIDGPILLISGNNDQIWPAKLMAEQVIARLKKHDFPYHNDHLSYNSAGQSITSYYWPMIRPETPGLYSLRGTTSGDSHAQSDSWPKVIQFLDDSLKKKLLATLYHFI
jgi:dienelactone hydrolase